MNDIVEMAGEGRQVVAQQVSATPADIVMYAMKNGGTVAEIREFMQLQREWEADQARKAFNVAMAEFSAEPIVITKDKQNTQFKSMYTGIGNLVNTVRPVLSKHGFSVDWELEQPDGKVKVTCVLSHALGHSKRVSFTIPPDTSGGGSKNPIQQIKSAMTYARSATFEAVCGLASSDANLDDDGNKFGTTDTKLADKWLALVAAAKTDADVVSVWNAGIGPIEASKDTHAYDEFKKAVGERRAEFTKAAKGGAK